MTIPNAIVPRGPMHLALVPAGQDGAGGVRRPAPDLHHSPAQERLGREAGEFRQPTLAAHVRQLAERHAGDPACEPHSLRERLDALLEENALLKKRLAGHAAAHEADDLDGTHDPVLAARQEALDQTRSLSRLNKLLQEARIIAKIQKDTLDWIMQNLL